MLAAFGCLFTSGATASVLTQLNGPHLFISGDSQANVITVVAGPIDITVTVGGVTPMKPRVFPRSAVTHVTVNTKNGDDVVNLRTTLNGPRPASRPPLVKLSVDAGSGADKVNLSGRWNDTTIIGGKGGDLVTIPGLRQGRFDESNRFDGSLTVRGGSGADSISIMDVNIVGRTRVFGGQHADSIVLSNNIFQDALRVNAGRDNDQVALTQSSSADNTGPFFLNGGPGNEDLLTGQFDLAQMQVVNFESIDQIPVDPIMITEVDRSTYAKSSYSDSSGPPPDNVIDEEDIAGLSSQEAGFWDGGVSTGVLSAYEGFNPITASASQVSDITATGGSLDIDLFSDRYWGSQPPGFRPFGIASAKSDFEVTFIANQSATLSIDGFISANRASQGFPRASVSVRVIQRGSSDVVIVQRIVNPQSTISGNDLVENLNGTLVALDAGGTYSIVVDANATSQATISQNNSEGEVAITWTVN